MLTAYEIIASFGLATEVDGLADVSTDPAHAFIVNGLTRLVREAREQWPERPGGFVLKLHRFAVVDEAETH